MMKLYNRTGLSSLNGKGGYMSRYYIVTALDGIEIECLYYGYKKDHVITENSHLFCGSLLKLTNYCRRVIGIGWYIQILLNQSNSMYVSLNDFEKFINCNKICSIVDFEIELSMANYFVNQALDNGDKEKFHQAAGQLKKLLTIQNKVMNTSRVKL